MSNITTTELEKLSIATEEQITSYYAGTDKILTDAYGIATAISNLVLYRGYLIPKTTVYLNNTRSSLSSEEFIEATDIYTWINVSNYDDETPKLRHMTDFGFCTFKLRYYPKEKLRELSENFYDRNRLAHVAEVSVNAAGEYILSDHSVSVYGNYESYHKNDDALVWSDHHDQYLLEDDAVYPEDDPDTPYHRDDVYINNGVAYTNEEAAYEGCIRDYHCTPTGQHFIKDDPNDVLSKFTIGFEVEKSSVDGYSNCGDLVDDQPLFAGWETDSSCGVEGITHVYSLNNLKDFSNDVYNSPYVNEETSSRCGGHINICDTTNTIKYWHIKSWCGLWWAMYRKRLRNDYSGGNKKVCPYESRTGQRYQAIREKTISGNKQLFELRLPNRVRNDAQLIRRFKLSQTWIRCIHAFATEDWTYATKKYTDVIKGVPDWAYNKSHEVNTAHLKATANIIADVPPHIFNRMRFLIEESKEHLLESYADQPLGLLTVIHLTYAFQVFIETERYTSLPESINNSINQYL